MKCLVIKCKKKKIINRVKKTKKKCASQFPKPKLTLNGLLLTT